MAKVDMEAATEFGVEIGKVYSYDEIKPHIHKHLTHKQGASDTDFLRSVLKIEAFNKNHT